jgi:hypothetical protein
MMTNGELETAGRMRSVPTSNFYFVIYLGGLRKTANARPIFEPSNSEMKVSVLTFDIRFCFRTLSDDVSTYDVIKGSFVQDVKTKKSAEI